MDETCDHPLLEKAALRGRQSTGECQIFTFGDQRLSFLMVALTEFGAVTELQT